MSSATSRRACSVATNLQGPCFGAVNNYVEEHREKSHIRISHVAPPASSVRKLREIGKRVADDEFHAVGCFFAAFVLNVTPDLNQAAGCLRRQDIARLHSGCALSCSKKASSESSGMPS